MYNLCAQACIHSICVCFLSRANVSADFCKCMQQNRTQIHIDEYKEIVVYTLNSARIQEQFAYECAHAYMHIYIHTKHVQTTLYFILAYSTGRQLFSSLSVLMRVKIRYLHAANNNIRTTIYPPNNNTQTNIANTNMPCTVLQYPSRKEESETREQRTKTHITHKSI